MNYSQTVVTGEVSMFSFLRKKRNKEFANSEAEIKSIQKQTRRKAELAAMEMEKLNKWLEDHPGDIAAIIVGATVGFGREK